MSNPKTRPRSMNPGPRRYEAIPESDNQEMFSSSVPNYITGRMEDALSASFSSSYRRASCYLLDRGESFNRQSVCTLPASPYDEEAPESELFSDIVQEEMEPFIAHKLLEKSTFAQSCFNAVNILMGIGLLSLPFAFKLTGWTIGICLLVFYGLITRHTAKLLALCLDYTDDFSGIAFTYGDIGEKAYGMNGRRLISILFFFELFAACIALVILAADSIVSLVDINLTLVKFLIIASLFPLTILKSLSFVAYGSLIGIIALVNMVFIILYFGFSTTQSPGSIILPAETYLYPQNWFQVPLAIGLIIAGFCGHSVFPNIYRDMKRPEKYNRMVDLTFLVTCIIYLVLGSVGYLMFGDLVKSEITQNLAEISYYNPILTKMTIVLVSLNPITKYPLTIAPINSQLEYFFDGEFARYLTCTITAVFVFVISVIFPGFHSIMALLGAFFSTVVSIVFPELCYLQLYGKQLTKWHKFREYLILTLATLFGILGTICSFLP